MEVAVLDVAHGDRAFTNFSRQFKDARRYDVHEGEFPEGPDAVVVTGSSSGVYEEEDWIPELLEKLQTYIEEDVPVLGVCFGHQAVAAALGGEVECMGKYEIGYREIELDEHALFDGLDRVEAPFSTHQDEVTSLPEELESIAENETSVHGFRHTEKPVFGVQFHPEYDRETVEHVIEKKDFNGEREQELFDRVTEENHSRAERTRQVFDNFSRLARQA